MLRVAISEPGTLDPMRIGDPGSVLVVRQLFEGLTRWDPAAQEVVPAAAESWTSDKKGKKWTFKLRRGMTFHDGTAVTADDFKYAFDRIALRKNASDIAYTLERIQGFIEVNQLGDANKLSGVKAKDDYTLEITLYDPYFDLPAVLTHPGLVPVPKDAVEAIDTFLAQPIGNGPFAMAAPWQAGEEVDLIAFDDAIETPGVDGIRMIPFSDPAESWLVFRDEQLDISEIPVGQFQAAEEVYGDQAVQPFLAGYYYGFNLKTPQLKKRNVRLAINIAIDREAIAGKIYRGSLVLPRGIVPAGMPGFENEVCGSLCVPDPDRAAQIVKNLPAKYRQIQLDYTKGQPHGKVARSIEKDLEDVGFAVNTRGYPFGRYLEKLRKGDHRLFRFGWIAEYPVPDVFLSSLFGSDSGDNQTGFKNSKVDDLLDRAHSESDADKRTELYVRAEEKIMAEIPIVPIGTFEFHWAAQPTVNDLLFDSTGGFDAFTITLSDE